MLDFGAKRRLTGAVVLVVLAVVFLPMLLEEKALQDPVPEAELRMPEPPPAERGHQAEIFPSREDTGPRPMPRPEAAPPVVQPAPGSTPAEVEPRTGSAVTAKPGAPGAPGIPPVPGGKPGAAGAPGTTLVPGDKPAGTAPPKVETSKPKPTVAEVVPEKTKAAAAPKPVPKGLTSWVVQVAAVATSDAAGKLERDLRGKGFQAFVQKLEGTEGAPWKVWIGPEVERSRADALAADVKKRTGHDVYVRKYRGD